MLLCLTLIHHTSGVETKPDRSYPGSRHRRSHRTCSPALHHPCWRICGLIATTQLGLLYYLYQYVPKGVQLCLSVYWHDLNGVTIYYWSVIKFTWFACHVDVVPPLSSLILYQNVGFMVQYSLTSLFTSLYFKCYFIFLTVTSIINHFFILQHFITHSGRSRVVKLVYPSENDGPKISRMYSSKDLKGIWHINSANCYLGFISSLGWEFLPALWI